MCVLVYRYHTQLSDDLRQQVRPSGVRFATDGDQLHPRLVPVRSASCDTVRSTLRIPSQHGNAARPYSRVIAVQNTVQIVADTFDYILTVLRTTA